MHECDSCAPSPSSRAFVDEAGTRLLQMRQGGLDVGYRIRDVVEAFAVIVQKSSDRRLGAQWLQELHERPAYRDHRFLDSLFLYYLPIRGLDPITIPVTVECRVEVMHRYRYVVEVE